jgi:hypothetical protein
MVSPGGEKSGFFEGRSGQRHAGGRLLFFKGGRVMGNKKAYGYLKPGQNGTKRLVEQFGKALYCVRYRIDEERGMKLKTAEIIVDEKPLKGPRYRNDDLVPVAVAYHKQELRELLRALRARWDGERKLWYVRYGSIRGTALMERLAERYA